MGDATPKLGSLRWLKVKLTEEEVLGGRLAAPTRRGSGAGIASIVGAELVRFPFLTLGRTVLLIVGPSSESSTSAHTPESLLVTSSVVSSREKKALATTSESTGGEGRPARGCQIMLRMGLGEKGEGSVEVRRWYLADGELEARETGEGRVAEGELEGKEGPLLLPPPSISAGLGSMSFKRFCASASVESTGIALLQEGGDSQL